MWEKILAQLAAKHSGVSKAVLTMIAKKLAEKVTEESGIEGAITDFEANSTLSIKDYADFVQQEGDKRVGEAQKTWETKNKKTETKTEEEVKKEDPNDVSAIVNKAVSEALKPFTEMAATMQNGNRMNNLKAQLKANGVDESWAEDVVFSSDYDEAQTVAKLKTRWDNTIQAGINKQVSEGRIQLGNMATEEQGLQAIKEYGESQGFTKEAGYNIQEV